MNADLRPVAVSNQRKPVSRGIGARIRTALIWIFAGVYFFVDVVSAFLLRPLRRWFDRVTAHLRITEWIEQRGPYQSLLLFAVPLIVLEPVKPVSLYLIGTGRFTAGALVLVIGEALKILTLERIFQITRPKLETFRIVAWAIGQVVQIMAYLNSLRAVQKAKRWLAEIKRLIPRRQRP